MLPINIKGFKLTDGVFESESAKSKFADFEQQYLKVREKEKRVLSLEEIRKLPFVPPSSPDQQLWKIRRKSLDRFFSFLSKKHNLSILDIGCGNGFFTNTMRSKGHRVIGVDVNITELRQAASAFPSSGVHWYYADILTDNLPEAKFDLITFCCSFQYFGDAAELLKRCHELLLPGGEIHIIDSPFYNGKTQSLARKNSEKYYQEMGVGSMSKYYFHHTLEVFKNYNYEVLYQPNKLLNKFFKDSPFLWIVVKN